jgi:hypothetical protein
MNKWILLCVGGTDSNNTGEKYGRGYTWDFFERFGVGLNSNDFRKGYIEGPDGAIGNITGHESGEIKLKCMLWIAEAINRLFPMPQKEDYSKRIERLKNIKKELKVVLVGHSRGGAIVVELAYDLKQYSPVYFMGLFDPVDRTFWLDNSKQKLDNTKYAYIALRGLENSRSSFGYSIKVPDSKQGRFSQTTMLGGEIIYEYFNTSHGGIDGIVNKTDMGISDDVSCVPKAKLLEYYSDKFNEPDTLVDTLFPLVGDSKNLYFTTKYAETIVMSDQSLTCEIETHEVWDKMLAEAKKYGINL